ncbi:MAG: integral rane sensor signal transduction histidine kinase [Firmicutes bacterium]|nr:integral rane sensor signal transduction histidine kinase [Bacillota bacterium]
MIRSIFNKILLSHITVILVSTITLALLMSYFIRAQAIDSKRQDLLAKGNAAIELLTPDILAGKLPTDDTLDNISDLVGGTIWLINENGTVIAGQPSQGWLRRFKENQQEISDLFTGNPQTWTRAARKRNISSITVALPIPDAPNPTAIFLDASITGVNNTVFAAERILFYSLIAGIFTAVILGLLISRSLTKPIANISQAARNFAKGDYDSRTTATTNDEIGSLGRTFNSMAESLNQIEQNRRNFLANVSHELRTPVTSIQALSETILDGMAPKPEQQQRYLTTIVQESKRLSRLINDLLDLSQLEADELSIVCQQINLKAWLLAEIDKIQPLLAKKKLTIHTDIPKHLPTVWGDIDRTAQVFTNLITNAIRHAPEGSAIDISLYTAQQHIAMAIADHGTGIPLADLPHIWDRFYRGDKSRARNHGGTGLGLAITKKLVQAMDGDIIVYSIPGQGATFTFTLPIAK